MAKTRTATAIVAALSLSACAQSGDSGGITTGSIMPAMPKLPSAASLASLVPSFETEGKPRPPERVSGNVYRVFSGDRKLDDTIQRQNYALLRAAESTKQVGGTHFVVVNGSASGDNSGASALVRMMKIEYGAEAPLGAVSADEIIHFFGPTFGRSEQASPAAPSAPAPQRS